MTTLHRHKSNFFSSKHLSNDPFNNQVIEALISKNNVELIIPELPTEFLITTWSIIELSGKFVPNFGKCHWDRSKDIRMFEKNSHAYIF